MQRFALLNGRYRAPSASHSSRRSRGVPNPRFLRRSSSACKTNPTPISPKPSPDRRHRTAAARRSGAAVRSSSAPWDDTAGGSVCAFAPFLDPRWDRGPCDLSPAIAAAMGDGTGRGWQRSLENHSATAARAREGRNRRDAPQPRSDASHPSSRDRSAWHSRFEPQSSQALFVRRTQTCWQPRRSFDKLTKK